MGRHSAPDADGESARPGDGGTRGDLEMLRRDPAVRARCIAAAVAPFALYTVMLIVLGQADLFLLWVWIPIVVAGILVGAFLDLGYRSARRRITRA